MPYPKPCAPDPNPEPETSTLSSQTRNLKPSGPQLCTSTREERLMRELREENEKLKKIFQDMAGLFGLAGF